MQGQKNSDLTEKGIDNAKKLAKRLQDIEFACIYCSPLGRAVETAKYIRGNRNIEITYKDNLKEMSFGIWEGLDHIEVDREYAL